MTLDAVQTGLRALRGQLEPPSRRLPAPRSPWTPPCPPRSRRGTPRPTCCSSRRTCPPPTARLPSSRLVQVTDRGGDVPFAGWGPFAFRPGDPGESADRIELRVWTPGTGPVSVYNLEMQPSGRRSSPDRWALTAGHPVHRPAGDDQLPSSTAAVMEIRYAAGGPAPRRARARWRATPRSSWHRPRRARGRTSLSLWVTVAPDSGARPRNGTVGADRRPPRRLVLLGRANGGEVERQHGGLVVEWAAALLPCRRPVTRSRPACPSGPGCGPGRGPAAARAGGAGTTGAAVPGPPTGGRTGVDHLGEVGVDHVALRGEEQGVERVAGDQDQLLGCGLHDRGAGRHHPVVDHRVVEGPTRRHHRDRVPRSRAARCG